MQSMSEMWVADLGPVAYRDALALQEALRSARQQDQIPDTLLLLEHDPAVYTRGRRSQPGELTMGEAFYAARGIEIIETKRGGRVTYHGPGQLVGYPIVATGDVVAYVRLLERSLIAALEQVGIGARARADEGPDYTGVWVEDRKIASIGVHVSQAVTTHGFALNVERCALEPFGWIVACGLPDVTMTCVHAEGADASLAHCGELAAASLAGALGHETVPVTRATLERAATPAAVRL